ncbi:hypothetical protein PENTCL1PPCAC_920, partial [Pristionchus entomophagus]
SKQNINHVKTVTNRKPFMRRIPTSQMHISSIVLLIVLPIASSLSNFPIVHTSYGAVRGYEHTAKNGFVGEIFKKIPFAAPPIGSRRWTKPVPPEAWNDTHDGTFFGPGCAQIRSSGAITGSSEDCVTLNIHTSKECREVSKRYHKLDAIRKLCLYFYAGYLQKTLLCIF